MTKLQQAIKNISFDGNGEYGLHDGFFNANTVIDGIEYDFQCCVGDTLDGLDLSDCGHDWGICGDANERLADVFRDDDEDDNREGYSAVLNIIEAAISKYQD